MNYYQYNEQDAQPIYDTLDWRNIEDVETVIRDATADLRSKHHE